MVSNDQQRTLADHLLTNLLGQTAVDCLDLLIKQCGLGTIHTPR